MPRRPYASLLELLRDDGSTFRERMSDVDTEQIADILGAAYHMPVKHRFFAEHYFTMVGTREGAVITAQTMHGHSQGNPGLVEFDWGEVWARHESHNDIVGWFHTHPPGAHGMSQTDRDTFHSWLVALGGVRHAVILCDGRTHCWRLWLDESYKLQWDRRDAEILSTGQIIINDPE